MNQMCGRFLHDFLVFTIVIEVDSAGHTKADLQTSQRYHTTQRLRGKRIVLNSTSYTSTGKPSRNKIPSGSSSSTPALDDVNDENNLPSTEQPKKTTSKDHAGGNVTEGERTVAFAMPFAGFTIDPKVDLLELMLNPEFSIQHPILAQNLKAERVDRKSRKQANVTTVKEPQCVKKTFVYRGSFFVFCSIFLGLYFILMISTQIWILISRIEIKDGAWSLGPAESTTWWFDQIDGLGDEQPEVDKTQEETDFPPKDQKARSPPDIAQRAA